VARATCTTTSTADAIWFRTAGDGSATPASSTSVSNRASASAGELRVDR
jgi:hypothetical protein